MDASTLRRFCPKFEVDQESGCWLWLKPRKSDGRGYLETRRKQDSAHRLSYEHFFGPVPPGFHLARRCQSNACVNPEHVTAVETTRPLVDRLLEKIDIQEDGCWLWNAARDVAGYGRFRVATGTKTTALLAHRVVYEVFVGPIPDGLTLDHVWARGCVHRHCVNPAHLEPVTNRENILRSESASALSARRTHCDYGHELTEDNVYRMPAHPTERYCRVCKRARDQEWWRTTGGPRRRAARALG